jgi:hypothetical protein
MFDDVALLGCQASEVSRRPRKARLRRHAVRVPSSPFGRSRILHRLGTLEDIISHQVVGTQQRGADAAAEGLPDPEKFAGGLLQRRGGQRRSLRVSPRLPAPPLDPVPIP